MKFHLVMIVSGHYSVCLIYFVEQMVIIGGLRYNSQRTFGVNGLVRVKMKEQHPYYNYYNRAINSSKNGFKLVLGGTGLGKTSGIVEVTSSAQTEGRKFIYCANRIQLLNEMGEKLQADQFVHLRRDVEIVRELILGESSEQFNKFLHSKHVIADSKGKAQVKHSEVVSAVQYIKQLSQEINSEKLFKEMIQNHARKIMHFFRGLVADANGKPRFEALVSHPIIQKLFPYIAFQRNQEIKVLLITIQKAFHGFFDGKQVVTLSSLNRHNGGHIIFLDEFDFLENDLISLICESSQIEETFSFVEYFYKAMKRHKLPLPNYPISPSIRNQIEEIVKIIDDMRDEAKIDFPTINQFTSSIPKQRLAIFQTTHTTSNSSLYLEQTERSFEIVKNAFSEAGANNLKAIRLFDTIHQASSRIIYLFKQLEANNPEVYREILNHCFKATIFKRLIPQISQLPQNRQAKLTRFDNLLNTGFGLYEIQDLQQTTDTSEVSFRHYSIYTTPEKILHTLAAHNLVFGLSATADIPRCVRNFDIDWLRRQGDVTFFDINQDDIKTINSLNDKKHLIRNNTVEVVQAKELDKTTNKGLLNFINAAAKFEEFGGDDKVGFRRRRVERFFASLDWILNNRMPEELKTDTHLLFFNTFAQIKYLFQQHQKPFKGIYSISVRDGDFLFSIYDLSYKEIEFIIVFYDADQAKLIQSSELAKKQYHKLFWENKPVILVTQYPSAGNGVNLQYRINDESKKEIDFKNIHLLEVPYFFFGRSSPDNSQSEKRAILKQNIWYLGKLFESKIVSEQWFKATLDNLRNPNLNHNYRNGLGAISSDALLNRLARYIQALGRIERVWQPMADQTIVLCREAYQDFQVYCTRAQYDYIRNERQATASNNLRQVFEQISAQTKVTEREMKRKREERLVEVEAICRTKIKELVKRLEDVRQNIDSTDARNDWLNLRKAVLQHDLQADILKKYSCVFRSPYYQDGILRINKKYDIFPPNINHGDILEWRLDSIYCHVAENHTIQRFFQNRGYELAFTTTSHLFITPYCYQSILAGAIGEEAIQAILIQEEVKLEPVSGTLFELADLKIQAQPWYVDCKNYSERTLDYFSLSADDPSYRPKLNDADFKKLAQHKLQRIKKVSPNCKLIFLNLVSRNNRPQRYFDNNFASVETFQEAEIIIIQGVLNRDNLNEYNESFNRFLSDLIITL